MSIASEIQRLQTAKADIKTAIEAKGVTVPSSATIDTYDDYVSQITGGLTRYASGTPYCNGTNLVVDIQNEISIDGGTSWVNSGSPYVVVVESGASECYDFSLHYLTFIATESGTFKLNGNSVYYSLDNGSTWNSLASNTNSPTVSAGSNIMFKATLTPSSNGIGKFSSTANFTVEGNPMSLLYGDNFIGQTDLTGKNNAFNSLFSGCTTITSAENVSLPATILSTSCYQYMFLDCSNLSVAPSVLSATSLAENCYNGMFGNCTSLTTAPKMLATTLVNRCCQYMYVNCSSLNSVTCIATNPSTSYTTSWLSGVAASGTFYKSPNATWSTGVNGIPSNWTVLDYSS